MEVKPKIIIGLGNPGSNFVYTRHNIGFRILESLSDLYSGVWKSKEIMDMSEINIEGQKVILVKPQTFMNSSGKVLPYFTKQGVKEDETLVIHDELELPFGKIALKKGGSAKGHNGLKSIISFIGPDFFRLRFGIGRPENREDVPDYVLQKFKESPEQIDILIDQSVKEIEDLYKKAK